MEMKREILELLPCTGRVFIQLEQHNGEIELIPVEMWARCIYTYEDDDCCCDDDCNCCDDCDCCDDNSEELVVPMVAMTDDEYLTFADEMANYIGLKRM